MQCNQDNQIGDQIAFRRRRLSSSLRIALAGLWCTLPSTAAPPPAPPKNTILKFEEQPSSNILYQLESGGLITTPQAPRAGSARLAMPPLSSPDAKAGALISQKSARELTIGRPQIQKKPILPKQTRPQVHDFASGGRTPVPTTAKNEIRQARPPLTPKPAAATPQTAAVTGIEDLAQERLRAYNALLSRLIELPSPAGERARRAEEEAGALITMYRDSIAAVQVGWLWLQADDRQKAINWFRQAREWNPANEEAIRGLAFTALADRQYDTALQLADELPNHSLASISLRRDAWVGAGQRDYGQEQFASAIAAFDKAATIGELPRYARMLRAWSRLKLRNFAGAANEFALLYRESADLESAQGLLAAVPQEVAMIDADLVLSEPLASMLRVRQGEIAFRARRFLEARALDASRWGSVGASGAVNIAAATGHRAKSGQSGLGKLDANLVNAASIALPLVERAGATFSIAHLLLDPGIHAVDDTIGSAAVGVAPQPRVAHIARVRESTVSIRLEKNLALTTALGSGVQGGAVAGRRIGNLALAATPNWGQVDARVYAEPVRESVLSWAGMVDPFGGPAWGGVRRVGTDLRVLYLAHAPYSAGLYLRHEHLIGTHVAANRRRAAAVSAGRDLGLPGFAYSSLSMSAGLDAYDRNLSRYTIGHGGYFSPQSYKKAGVAFDFMTDEGKRWLVRGRAEGARTWKREDPAPFLPLTPDGRVYAANRNKGHEASARLSAVTMLGSHVQVGASLARGISPQFSDKTAMLEVRVLFSPRQGVVSTDLPSFRTE